MTECNGSQEANDSILAYRVWEISESILIDRTAEFDDLLSIGDKFSSYTKDLPPELHSQSPTPSTSTSPEVPDFTIDMEKQTNSMNNSSNNKNNKNSNDTNLQAIVSN